MERYKIKSDKLIVYVSDLGAKLRSIIYNGNELLWQGDEKIWKGQAPNLFPFIGRLKDSEYIYNGKTYKMTKHGFARDLKFEVVNHKGNEIIFKLSDNDYTKEMYPFGFDFYVKYFLNDNQLEIEYEVVCKSDEMYFSLGAHPAFKCDGFEGCYIDFNKDAAVKQLFLKDGLIGREEKKIADRIMPLKTELFDSDALIYEYDCDTIAFINKPAGVKITVDANGFSYLGFWSALNNDKFICIEPWCGVDDYSDTDKNLKTKKGIQMLKKNQSFKRRLRIVVE